MRNLSFKQKVIIGIITIGIALIAIFQHGLYSKLSAVNPQPTVIQKRETPAINPDQNASPRLVSTNPQNLKETPIILPLQTLEITFDQPMENRGEVKNSLDPKQDYIVELSQDKKTAKFIPNKPYISGREYTLTIKSDTKFDGKKTLGHDEVFHFRTISYQGV